MMTVLKINITDTLGCVKNALKEIDEQDAAIKGADDNIASLDGTWESAAKPLYVENFRKSRAEMEQFNETQRSYFRMMQTFAEECGATDNTVGASLKSVTW
jgi:uncharacterized protein YukE